MEVGRPDTEGRATILQIHAEKMRSSGRLALEAGGGGDDAGSTDGCSLGEQVGDEAYGAPTEAEPNPGPDPSPWPFPSGPSLWLWSRP